MGAANQAVGYLAGVAMSAVFYVVWMTFTVATMVTPGAPSGGSHVDLLFTLGFAVIFLIFEGAGAALALLLLPWPLAVMGYRRLRLSGPIYFVLVGAFLMLVVGCGTASLSPKPLFVEDQTFLEGVMIAVERQGIWLLLTGSVFGLTFWLVSERLRHPSSIEASEIVQISPSIE